MDNDERKSVEESIIQACKEVNLMRAGLMPKQTWEEFLAEQEKISDRRADCRID